MESITPRELIDVALKLMDSDEEHLLIHGCIMFKCVRCESALSAFNQVTFYTMLRHVQECGK